MTDRAGGESPTTPRRPRRRRHPALGTRIAVTGLSTTTMFGIVAALGVAGASQEPTESADTIPTTNPTVTVDPAMTTAAAPDPTTTLSAPVTATVPVTELSDEPIQLNANPVVRVVEVPAAPAANSAPAAAPAPQQHAPVASTNGSR